MLGVRTEYFFVTGFVTFQKNVRHLILDRQTNLPSIAGSVFEASLSQRFTSPNTIECNLRGLAYLLSWGKVVGVDVNSRLLKGRPLEPNEISGFSEWLESKLKRGERNLSASGVETYNHYLLLARNACNWFLEQFYQATDIRKRPEEIFHNKQYMNFGWDEARKRSVDDNVAPDLTDEEVSEVENFLRVACTSSNPEARWVRAYLIWRLCIEMGLRLGEVLALRTKDVPNGRDAAFNIVRVEHRLGDPPDPRGRYAPRPKTKSRDLLPVLANTQFPALVNEYMSINRHGLIRIANGAVRRKFRLGHDYLIVGGTGQPLSVSTAKSYAAAISRETGVNFCWHLARHAFFNRAYAGMIEAESENERGLGLDTLMYYGGWNDPESIQIYSRRARRTHSSIALSKWNNSWGALGA